MGALEILFIIIIIILLLQIFHEEKRMLFMKVCCSEWLLLHLSNIFLFLNKTLLLLVLLYNPTWR